MHVVGVDGSRLADLAAGDFPSWSSDSAPISYERNVKSGKGRRAGPEGEISRIAGEGGSEVKLMGDCSGDAEPAARR